MVNRYFLSLSSILLIKAALVILFILYGTVHLGPDEAQYWTWSQDLAWGYYSKPPGIAWQIWGGTSLFGNTELGVRFLSVIFSFLLSLTVYAIAMAAGTRPRTAFWAGIVMALSPLGILSSLFATTDVGMVLCWSLACVVMVHALREERAPNYWLLGTIIMCGALFKWPIYLFWGLVIASAAYFRYVFSWQLFGGVAISLLGLLPSVIWNVQNEWATFRHVGTAVFTDKQQGQGNFFDFFGAQVALLSPIFFGLLLCAWGHLMRHRKTISAPMLFCGGSSLVILATYLIVALFKKMQGNWSVFVYPTAIVFMCWYACEWISSGKQWLRGGLIVSLILSLFLLFVPSMQSQSILSSVRIPYSMNAFRQNVGWEHLSPILTARGYDPKEHFLFGDKYQMSSLLSFYSPEQKRAYFLNLHGTRKNQFSFWPGMAEEQLGKTGYFVLAENRPYLAGGIEDYQTELSKYFDSVQFQGVFPLFEAYGEQVKGALVFKCVGYNGKKPEETQEW